MINQTFGRLTVIDEAPRRSKTRHRFWRCKCICEKVIIADGSNLRNGHTTSCGCKKIEVAGKQSIIHGQTGSPEFVVWVGMRQRCNNPNTAAFKDYGGRGIYIDSSWNTFEQFLKDMGPRPARKTLDRIDNNGPYSKENCRWVDNYVQHNNTRKNTQFSLNGRSQTMAQWARELKIKSSTLWMRLHYGWSIERTLNTPVKI